ncbi:MAG: beta-lactamase family protein [Ruminococcaceae bacterium]|nr:beta-lactamase family protein [Oscillospiraceae bacterium]
MQLKENNMSFDRLSSYLDTLSAADIKNFNCVVAKDHEIIFKKAVGCSDYEGNKPAALDDVYLLYSATKVITCTAAMRLVSEGKLGIDDPVYKYLPEYKNLTVRTADGVKPCETVMTVRHLFTMTSGFGGRFDPPIVEAVNELLKKDPHAGTVAVTRAFAKAPLEFEPGTHYKYGTAHDILGAVVEVASGKRFGEYLNEIIFAPLGMTDFAFKLNESTEKRLCSMYSYNTRLNFSEPIDRVKFYGYTDNYESGGASLFGTSEQYILLADALACGGLSANGYRVLDEKYVMMMRENLLDKTPLSEFRASPRKYGYGWGLCGRVHMSPEISLSKTPKGEFGWDGAAGAYVMMDTDNRLSIVCGMHTMHCSYAYEKIHTNVRDLVYKELGLSE